ncbi:GNAT family N-acetyltransferase [Caldanaerobacter subterraneus]|uniref:Acetyltransferase (GNAT) family protein n=1 Tax=Caldanaerobacter subterraneus TaxID=911092 RepID=A0A4R2K5W3_9THEO|nr:GNAT family N-acetyltransferase [Caldanaerobacter subterraneus]TCO68641.1 acetyltransferase (GNAT) family protein [Caldanaerobacter subterraneus]
MEGPRACRKEEFKEALDLINHVFRITQGHEPTMGQEFPLLLSEDNLENMRVIAEDGKIVSIVNFYITTILIEGTPIKAASVGAVCTHEDYRGKGYSSLLLDDAEKEMKKKGVDVVLVSGDRSLYLRRGYCKAGWAIRFDVYPEELGEDIELVEFEDKYLIEMAKMYNKQTTRYYRSLFEFKNLLKGATTPWGNFTYKTYLVKRGDVLKGYVVLRIIHENPERGYVVEYGGDERTVLKSLKKMAVVHSLTHIRVPCTFNEKMVEVIKEENIPFEEINLLGTVKVLNFKQLMEKLVPYFSQYVEKEIIKNLKFVEDEGKYTIEFNGETLTLDGVEKLTKLVFGDKGFGIALDGVGPRLKEFFSRVFPLPFVWPGNLNFQ